MKKLLLLVILFSLSSFAETNSTQSVKKYTNIDFNNDGIADILWRKGSGNYLWYMNVDGKHTYKNIGRKSTDYNVEAIADFNNDGYADILWKRDKYYSLWYMKADGKHTYKYIGSKPTLYGIEFVADFNGDGIADILWKKGKGNYLWYMKSDGKHTYKNIGSKPIEYRVEGVADFNGDGNADILWKKGKGNYLWYMKADGKHTYKNIGSKPIEYRIEGVADFNGDGNADILWKKGKGNYLWYMKVDGKHTYKNIGSKPIEYRVEGVADFNGDGNADILWKKGKGNYLWYMKVDGKHKYKNIGSKPIEYSVMLSSQIHVILETIKGYLSMGVPLEGVAYSCGTIKSVTTATGEFACAIEPISFSIGTFTLGKIDKFTSDTKVYPQDLLNLERENFENQKLIDLIRVIASLDNDKNISDKVTISSDTRGSFVAMVDNLEVEALVSLANGTLLSEEAVIAYLKEGMSEYVAPLLANSNLSVSENGSIIFGLNENNESNLTFTIISKPTHGSLVIDEDNVTYTPIKDFFGVDSFSYQSNNGKYDSNIATVTISVNDFIVTSTTYSNGGIIPKKNVCSYYGGKNISPQFSWENAPEGTTKYALIMDDEVSPCGIGKDACKHWGLFNIPSTTNILTENFNPLRVQGMVEGFNYEGSRGYAGPCPPSSHKYKTTVYALSESMPNLGSSMRMTRSQFLQQYGKYILNTTTMEGIFKP